jgi:hypothetical protein
MKLNSLLVAAFLSIFAGATLAQGTTPPTDAPPKGTTGAKKAPDKDDAKKKGADAGDDKKDGKKSHRKHNDHKKKAG